MADAAVVPVRLPATRRGETWSAEALAARAEKKALLSQLAAISSALEKREWSHGDILAVQRFLSGGIAERLWGQWSSGLWAELWDAGVIRK